MDPEHIVGKTVAAVEWTAADALKLTFTDGVEVTLPVDRNGKITSNSDVIWP